MNNHISSEAEEKEDLTPGINEKLKRMAENAVSSYIHYYCEKKGIVNFKTLTTPSGGSVVAYIDIGKNKCLNVLFLFISHQENLSYLPVLYDCSKKIVNTPIKVHSKYLSNWRYPKIVMKLNGDKEIQEYHAEIQRRLHSLGIECKIFGYKDYCRVKIIAPQKICPLEARISYSKFSSDLSALEDLINNTIEFENIPINAYIIKLPKFMMN